MCCKSRETPGAGGAGALASGCLLVARFLGAMELKRNSRLEDKRSSSSLKPRFQHVQTQILAAQDLARQDSPELSVRHSRYLPGMLTFGADG